MKYVINACTLVAINSTLMLLLLHLQRGRTFFGGQALGCRCMIDCLRCTIMPSACCRISAEDSARVVLCCQNYFCAPGLRSKAIGSWGFSHPTLCRLLDGCGRALITLQASSCQGGLCGGGALVAPSSVRGRWGHAKQRVRGCWPPQPCRKWGTLQAAIDITDSQQSCRPSGDTSLHPLPSSLIGATSLLCAGCIRVCLQLLQHVEGMHSTSMPVFFL